MSDDEGDDLLGDLDALSEGGGDDVLADAASEDDDKMETNDTLLEELKPMDARALAKLLHSQRLKDHLQNVQVAMSKPRSTSTVGSSIEDDPEYKLIVDSNVLMVELENELLAVHKFVRDNYGKKFPELEQLVPSPMEYIKVVQLIKNEMDLINVNLTSVLPVSTGMIVTVSATTSAGRPLDDDTLARVLEACDLALALDDARTKLLAFIESRMGFIAPNLSAIVSPMVAAKLVGAAGGLAALSRITANIIQIMGAKKKDLAGLSSRISHQSYIFNSEVIQKTPPALRMRACRLVASKCALVARMDWSREAPTGRMGQEMREMIEAKIEKWQEPAAGKQLKALAAPIEKPKKKRGGRKYRKMRERLGMTDVRKQINRMEFGGKEDSYEATGKGFGMLGQQGSGVRITTKDTKIMTKAANLLKKDAAGTRTGSKSVSGLASSLAFTPVQGLELENPLAAQQRLKEKESGYFTSLGFLKPKTT